MKSLRKQGIILFTIFALVLAACGGDAAEEEVVEETAPEVVETLDSPAVTTASTVKTGVGVTSDPCPETVGSFPTGADPDKGCIYLGLLNDYTGPYGALGPALELGQRSFWLWANNAGGIGDYSVAIVEGYDTQYNPQKHLEGYNSQRDSVAALAMSLGTPQTLFILDELDKDNTIAAPMSWWSGYAYKDADKGLIVEFGAAYCAQGMNSVDWALNNLPVDIKTIGIMGFAGDYGGDWASGVAKAAAANGLDVAWTYVPPAPEFDVAQAVGLMVTQPVDAYFPALGPTQMAQVAGGAFQQGLTPIAMMASPSFNDAFVQEGFALAPLFTSGSMYVSAHVGPYESDTPGHAAMRATFEAVGQTTGNLFVTAGWSSQYHLKGVLEAAIKGGDLTRAGIRRAAANVDVSSDGMMVKRSLGQEGADVETFIGVPTSDSLSGINVLSANYVGPSAAGYDWNSGPCG